MFAGTAKIDITPQSEVWMEGMIREHRSSGVHDPLHARALYLSSDDNPKNAYVLLAMDICVFGEQDGNRVRRGAEKATGIPHNHIILAASHTHSGPSTKGYFQPREEKYVDDLIPKLIHLVGEAASKPEPASAGCASGREDSISHYRRLLAKDGSVVMNWESYPPEDIVKPLGDIDPELGVLKITAADGRNLCLVFNHAGHPNVLSGENYLISADYPGLASQLVEEKFGCIGMFLNGAQGSMDIDGLRDRDWEGRERIGNTLARSVARVAENLPTSSAQLRGGSIEYSIPTRKISDMELAWAEKILAETGGTVQPLIDGVGDDYKATLLKKLRDRDQEGNHVEHICVALDDTAFISFPGELFTEVGEEIKRQSPFKNTYIVGLANGTIGYVPPKKAIEEGGYAVDTRELDDGAADMVVDKCLTLLRDVHGS